MDFLFSFFFLQEIGIVFGMQFIFFFRFVYYFLIDELYIDNR